MNVFLRIYDFLHQHTTFRRVFLFCFVGILLTCALRLRFKEDIADFLPLDEHQQTCMQLYQDLSESDKIVIIFQLKDTVNTHPDRLADAIDAYRQDIEEHCPELVPSLTTQIDYGQFFSLMEHVCSHIPYFLTEADYARIDTLLQNDYIPLQMARRRQQLQLPLSGVLSQQIIYDPLDLFPGPLQGLRQYTQTMGAFTSYDGYMITADRKLAFAFLSSPYGMSETKRNTILVKQLTEAAHRIQTTIPDVSIRLNGAPVVAVGNADRIKKDSILAVSLSMVITLALLLHSFRRKRDLLLILVSVGFGWLTGMGVMGLLRGSISLIVLGISSVMIGIAVNYPLHLLVHRQHTNNTRTTLQETLSPLIIGNITTVGAFLTLVPLQATALRDLGIFSAAMLIGTIIFSVVFLPHLLTGYTDNTPVRQRHSSLLLRVAAWQPDKNKPLVIICLLLTVVFGIFSWNIRFDTDISHLNYMTRSQREDFNRFAQLAGQRQGTEIWLAAEGNDWSAAVFKSEQLAKKTDSLLSHGILLQERSIRQYIPSREQQAYRLERWNKFLAEHKTTIVNQLCKAAAHEGFRQEAFQPFLQMLDEQWQVREWDFFYPLAENIFRGYWIADSTHFVIVDKLIAEADNVQNVEACFAGQWCFDMATLNAQVAVSLSDSFNYIGMACSLIVFIFLWIAFRKFSVALIAFVPMAVSWLWILGIMSLTGTCFNIVNIILATFIFGQGDDYTIFITEGILYEQRHGHPMLPQYKSGILLSAVIMFTGIGVLIIARHPAMHSLGAVTLIGMSAVILMAFLLPPLLFRFIGLKRCKKEKSVKQSQL